MWAPPPAILPLAGAAGHVQKGLVEVEYRSEGVAMNKYAISQSLVSSQRKSRVRVNQSGA